MTFRTTSIWTLALVLTSTILTGQETVPEPAEEAEQESAYIETIDVNIVNVEVYVTDKQGNPITGLTAKDFEIFEDGNPVAISNFYAVEDGQRMDLIDKGGSQEDLERSTDPLAHPERSAEEEIPEDQRLHLVVYIDNYNIRPFNRNRVFRRMREFLNDNLSRGDRVMLVSYDRSLNIRHQFTADPQLIANALFDLETVTGHAVHLDSERRDVMRDIEEAEGVGEVDWRIRQFAENQANDLAFTIDALKEIIDSLAGLSGRKAVLYVSDGLPMVPGEDLYYALNHKFHDSSAVMLSREFDNSRRFIELTSRASTNRVVMYTIDAAGLRAPEAASVEVATADTPGLANFVDTVNVSNIQAPLLMMAEETGGRAIYNTNDVGPGLERMASDFRSYYSLGYSPAHNGTGRLYKIKIKMREKRKGLRIRHRASYRDKPLNSRMSDVARASLTYGFDSNPLDLVVRFLAIEMHYLGLSQDRDVRSLANILAQFDED
jgi:VWFA-related protein